MFIITTLFNKTVIRFFAETRKTLDIKFPTSKKDFMNEQLKLD